MRAKLAGLLLWMCAALSGQSWQPAKPGYQFSFPRDHFSHPNFQTEWWYYTGNLRAADGHRFGYELTFFRQATRASEQSAMEPPDWRSNEIYLAHLALSDIDGRQFFHTHRLNRAGPGLAGGDQHNSRYWNGNWQVRWMHPAVGTTMELQAVCDDLHLTLQLQPQKRVVVNGEDGIDRKGPLPGESSHYVSFTRIASQGRLDWKGKTYQVSGLSWMDHEFFTEPPDNALSGWDWFAIQLDSGEDLMLYRLRRDGGGEDYSSGTVVDAQGRTRHLRASDFRLTPGAKWTRYPVAWHISIPSLALELDQSTDLQNQELTGKSSLTPSYWEGAVNYQGTLDGKKVRGVGYLEMTGYGSRMRLGS